MASYLPPDFNILGQNWQKTAKIYILRVKKWFYVIDKIFWHILAKFKKYSRNGFFTKSQKLPKMAKNGLFSHKWAVFEKTWLFIKKAAVWRFLYFWPPTSYQVSEKSSERFLRYAVTNKWTDLILHNTSKGQLIPGTEKRLILEVTKKIK